MTVREGWKGGGAEACSVELADECMVEQTEVPSRRKFRIPIIFITKTLIFSLFTDGFFRDIFILG